MLFHCCMLALCLWHSLLGTPTAVPLPGVGAAPRPQPTAGPGEHAVSSGGRRDSLFWSFWKPIETKSPSFLSMPFGLPFGPWSTSPQSGEANTSPGTLKVTSALSTNPSGWTGSNGSASEPTMRAPHLSSSEQGSTGVPEREKPSTPIISNDTLKINQRDSDTPVWATESSRREDISSQTATQQSIQTVFFRARGDRNTSVGKMGTTETTDLHIASPSPSALDSMIVEPTFTPEQDARNTRGSGPKIKMGLSGDGTSSPREQMDVRETTDSDGGAFEDFVNQPTETQPASATTAGVISSEAGRKEGLEPMDEEPSRGQWTATLSSVTTPGTLFTGTLPNEDWLLSPTVNQSSSLPDCNMDTSAACNSSSTWSPAFPDEDATSNQSYNPFLLLSPHMFVPLYSDWNTAMATWGVAWEAHVYGLGSLFAAVAFISVLNLLCLPFRCPSGCGYFALVNLFLLVAGCSRAFSLFYDAYSHQDRLPASGTLLLYEAPFPCLTAAFGIVFLLLSMRSRMQLSHSVFQHPCFLAVLVLLHFVTTFGSVALLQVFTQLPCLFFISQGAFVLLAAFLSATYFVFYCYVRADSKHIYHLNNTSPPIERYNRCPLADAKDWDRAAATAVFSALFVLACAGLQLYAMLHALGLGGTEVFPPWPWWAFHLSCRLCEGGVCLTLALVVLPPLYCSNDLPQPSCWPKVFRGHLAMKSPVLPNNYPWSLSQQEKLVVCDTITRSESECFPLYTLVDHRLGSIDGLDLLYHSNRALATRDTDILKPKGSSRKSSFSSLRLDSDSTADLRPPSPINLRRSIDEALFSEALFSNSLFNTPSLRSPSNLSLSGKHSSDGPPFRESSADRSLYRTSSCVEMEAAPPPASHLRESSISSHRMPDVTSTSSTERWRGSSSSSLYRASLDGSSLVLCSSPERQQGRGNASFGSSCIAPGNLSQSSLNQVAHLQRRYQALGSASQESLDQPAQQDLAVQAEFISVCRQIDALSVCSDTIDL